MNDKEFADFLEKCNQELSVKQEALQTKFKLGSYSDYWWDQEKQTLEFKNNNKVMLKFRVIFVGTWAFKKKDWRWAWANDSMLPSVRDEAQKIKKLAKVTGREEYTLESFPADEYDAWEITASAVHSLKGLGAYRAPDKKNWLFLVLMDKI